MERQNSVYVRMLEDVLKKKEHLLRDILERTREQEALLKQEELDQERFHEILEEKGRWIEALNEMDEGFDTLFAKVESEIRSHKDQYKENIQQLAKKHCDCFGVWHEDPGTGESEQREVKGISVCRAEEDP